MKKVMLAFSGGLDTCFSIPYLKKQGYQVSTVTVDTGGFTPDELNSIAQKSEQLGAHQHYQIDAKQEMYQQLVSYIIKTNGLYQGSYPNMCTDRYVIAQKVLEVAKKEKCTSVAHGSSAMGNDQVRFDVALRTLQPDVQILSPIKDIGGDRKYEQKILAALDFPLPSLHKKYSVNQNILGVTYSGSEIDLLQEPDQDMFVWTKQTATEPKYIKIEFQQGVPIKLNDNLHTGPEILALLNKELGSYGYGRKYYTGDCIIGIKGHIVFEAPAILGLIEAHRALEQLVLTKHQQTMASLLNQKFTDLLYTGQFFEPAVADLQAFIDSQQSYVSGTVTLKVEAHAVQAVSLDSPHSLINDKVATYAQHCAWSVADADGFIKLFGLQSQLAAKVHQKNNKG